MRSILLSLFVKQSGLCDKSNLLRISLANAGAVLCRVVLGCEDNVKYHPREAMSTSRRYIYIYIYI
jgi:hypothetical protein